MSKTVENTNKLMFFVASKYEGGELDNDSLVQLIELAGSYLNIKTIPDYCKEKGISYNGAKHHRNPITILGVKFIIDND